MNSLYIDPVTGGYLVKDSKLVYVDSVVNKVNYLIKENQALGIKPSPTNINTLVANMLNPLIQSSDIVNFSVLNYSVSVLGKWTINISVIINSKKAIQFSWEPK